MKATNQPTEYILIQAQTNSEWDECRFALIHCTQEWKEKMKLHLHAVQPFTEDYNFCSLNYYDALAGFYRTVENDLPDTEAILMEKSWVFVELEDNEQNTFITPENSLDCYQLSVYRNGTAMYSAYGKHTGEEFWTEEFSIPELLNYH